WASVTCTPDHYADYAVLRTAAVAELEASRPGRGRFAQSITFILARLQDNAIGNRLDPEYEGRVRAWDLGATQDAGDWTAGIRMAVRQGVYYIEDVERGKWSSGKRDDRITG